MRKEKRNRAVNKWALALAIEGMMQMKNRAFIKADISDRNDPRGYEVDVQAGGDLYLLVKLLHEILGEIAGASNVSIENLVSAAAAETPEVFERDYSELFKEYLRGSSYNEIERKTK